MVGTVPANGLVLLPVSLNVTTAGALNKSQGFFISKVLLDNGKILPSQWIPDDNFLMNHKGVLLVEAHGISSFTAQLQLISSSSSAKEINNIEVFNKEVEFDFDEKKGMFPYQLKEVGENIVENQFVWNDRLYSSNLGQFFLRNGKATIRVMSDGNIATVVRTSAFYTKNDQHLAPGNPKGVYDWYFFKKEPLVYVSAQQESAELIPWQESHFLEWNFSDNFFKQYSTDNVADSLIQLTASKRAISFNRWGILVSQTLAIGIIRGNGLLYDGYQEYGTYVHSQNPNAWAGWQGNLRKMDAWLWVGKRGNINAVAKKLSDNTVSYPLLTLDKTKSIGTYLPQKGARLTRERNSDYIFSGNTGLLIQKTVKGFLLKSYYDFKQNQEFLSPTQLPFLMVSLMNVKNSGKVDLNSDKDWDDCNIVKKDRAVSITLSSNRYKIKAIVTAQADTINSAWDWKVKIQNSSSDFTLENIAFSNINLLHWGTNPKFFYPDGPGKLMNQPFTNWHYRGDYPSGWATMQWLALYETDLQQGLYIANHDATGFAKTIVVDGNQTADNISIKYNYPVENSSLPGNGFELPGVIHWQRISGDWYTAATIYKNWVMRNAEWYLSGASNMRKKWLNELDSWLLLSGDSANVSQRINLFKEKYINTNLGIHWYNWHSNPFDNDYPHYFPAKPGFKGAVEKLATEGIYTMPYINGRLWDTKDKGTLDWEFTKYALPSATKELKNNVLVPVVESYLSTESDGSKVRLAAMCPSTTLWQDTVCRNVVKLVNECKVKAVYLDQIASSCPVLCMDKTHGHPLSGGNWWVNAYRTMLKKIRRQIPDSIAITSEDNAETYIGVVDGFLTWHWLEANSVPAFPYIYNKVVATFGRDYRGDVVNLGLMKTAAQQLTFGEQLGWIDVDFFERNNSDQSKAFFKKALQISHLLKIYFTEGELQSPSMLNNENTFFSSVWKLAKEKKMVFIFANTSDRLVKINFQLNPSVYSIPQNYKYHDLLPSGTYEATSKAMRGKQIMNIILPARSIASREIQW